MGNIFEIYYSFVQSIYGKELSDYISGSVSELQDANMYSLFGWIMLVTTALALVIYYFKIDRFSLNHWWCWCITVAIPGLFNFIVGWAVLERERNTGCMVDEEGNDLGFGTLDFISFGLANLLIVMITAIVITLIFKVLFATKLLHSDCAKSPLAK